ncbi:hypothetical protein Tco_0542764 [Tanacetum coccineum]
MEQAVEQHRLESRTLEVKINQVLSENERILAQAINNEGCETVNECQKCLELKIELLNKKDFVDKETYDKLCKSFTTLEKHCITLEADSQLNQEIFQQTNSVLDQNAPSFTQLFELSELRAQSQAKDTVIVKLKEQIKSLKGNVDDSKVKMDMDEIETLNIELEHRVTKLVAENEHLKQTYKQLYDSIKPKRVQSKEQCDALIKQVNIKSGEISDLNAKLQEQGLVIAALKNELRKLKGKALDKEAIETHSVDPKVSKDNMEPITPKLLNKRTAHASYIKHTQEEALVLKDIVEHVKANYPQDSLLESAFRYTKVIQDLLSHISRTCPSINNFDPQLVAITPRKKDKKVRLSTSASGSQPSGNTRNDRIQQTPSSNSKNKVEAHPKNVKSSLNKRNGTVKVNGSAPVQNSKKHDNFDYVCINGDDCMSSDNLCVSNSMNDVKFCAKSKKRKSKREIWKPTVKVFNKMGYIWRPTARTFTIVGNACPLTRITTTNEVPYRKPIVLESESPKPVVNLYIQGNLGRLRILSSLAKMRLSKSSSGIWTPIARSTYRRSLSAHQFHHNILVRLKETVRRIRTDNGSEFVNQTLREYYEKLTVMASEHNSSGPALHDMTPVTISSGLVLNPPPSTPFVPPLRSDWDLLFQPMFDESLNPPPYVDLQAPEVIAPIPEVVAPAYAVLTGSPSSTTVNQDAPSPIAHMGNDSYFGIPILEVASDQCSSSDVIHTIVPPDHQVSEHNSKWTKDHPLENIIACWRNYGQEELYEFERLEVWELVPPPDKAFVITLKCGYSQVDKSKLMRFKKEAIDPVTALSCNQRSHSKIQAYRQYFIIKENVENGVIELYFVNTEYQFADIFTKALGRERIEFLINKLCMRSFTPETLKKLADDVDK